MNIKDTRLQNFRHILKARGIKLKDVANLLDKAPSQVSAFGGRQPTKGIGDQIAREFEKAMGLPAGYLDLPIGWSGAHEGSHLTKSASTLPVMDATAAGQWVAQQSAGVGEDTQEWVNAPGAVGASAFAFKVDGISMTPVFNEGDMVIIDPSLEICPGNFVVASADPRQPLLLRQLKQEGHDRYLYSVNPDWPNRVTKLTERWRIYGRAKWKISRL